MRCLDDQAFGRSCKVAAYEASIERVVQDAADAIDGACTEADYAELGFDTGAARPEIAAAALGHVQTLIRQTYPLSYEGKPTREAAPDQASRSSEPSFAKATAYRSISGSGSKIAM